MVTEDATKAEHQNRIKKLQKFIQSQSKRLLANVTLFGDYLDFEFKSGVTISVRE